MIDCLLALSFSLARADSYSRLLSFFVYVYMYML